MGNRAGPRVFDPDTTGPALAIAMEVTQQVTGTLPIARNGSGCPKSSKFLKMFAKKRLHHKAFQQTWARVINFLFPPPHLNFLFPGATH